MKQNKLITNNDNQRQNKRKLVGLSLDGTILYENLIDEKYPRSMRLIIDQDDKIKFYNSDHLLK
jgi:hypothetical protein